MLNTLFYTFISVFVATAVVTLLGITNLISIEEVYLRKLFYSLIVGSIGPVIVLFKRTNFFPKTVTKRVVVYLKPKGSFKKSGEPYQCTIDIFNTIRNSERKSAIKPKRTNGWLVLYLEEVSDDELIRVKIRSSKKELWESEYFNPNQTNADMERIAQ